MQPPLEKSDIWRWLRPLVRRPILKEETLSDGGCDRGNSAREGQLDLGSNDKPHKNVLTLNSVQLVNHWIKLL